MGIFDVGDKYYEIVNNTQLLDTFRMYGPDDGRTVIRCGCEEPGWRVWSICEVPSRSGYSYQGYLFRPGCYYDEHQVGEYGDGANIVLYESYSFENVAQYIAERIADNPDNWVY